MPNAKPSLGRTILTHVIVGPPAGTLAFMTFMVTAAAFEAKTGPSDLWSFVSVLPMAAVIGYVLGAIPAMVSSLFAHWVIQRTDSVARRLIAAAVIGALASCLGLIWVILGPNGDIPKVVVIGAFAFTGALAALVSMLVVVAMTPRSRSA